MDIWLFPTSNVLVNTLLRALTLVAFMVFFLKTDFYTAYWAAVIHDIITLPLIYKYIY